MGHLSELLRKSAFPLITRVTRLSLTPFAKLFWVFCKSGRRPTSFASVDSKPVRSGRSYQLRMRKLPMKTILLHIHYDTGMEARFQAALSLTRDQDAHLTCIQAIPTPHVPWEIAASASTIELLIEAVEEPARSQRAALEPRLASEMVKWDWCVRTGDAVRELLNQSMLADVIIVGSGSGEEAPALRVAGAVAVHAPIPVLAIPIAAKGFDPSGPMVVAWNGSSEAANALRHGLPLLSRAASVHLVAIDEANLAISSADAATYLSRHGIQGQVQERRAEPSIAESLEAAAREIGAACIVMGAYGHSRMRELTFGGVTRHMLQNSPIPLLLSH
jgi:nucleotide-binding universal stress UspA family protein